MILGYKVLTGASQVLVLTTAGRCSSLPCTGAMGHLHDGDDMIVAGTHEGLPALLVAKVARAQSKSLVTLIM